jgi:hypothetical protein
MLEVGFDPTTPVFKCAMAYPALYIFAAMIYFHIFIYFSRCLLFVCGILDASQPYKLLRPVTGTALLTF